MKHFATLPICDASQRAVPECDWFFRLGDRGAWLGRVL